MCRKEGFDFLGFSVGIVKGKQSGKELPLVEPSAKALKSIKEEIKFYTRREMNPVPTVRGWSQYFQECPERFSGFKQPQPVKYHQQRRPHIGGNGHPESGNTGQGKNDEQRL